MEWNRSESIGLAAVKCTHCGGLGLREGARRENTPCGCVLRAIFRECFRRFRECAEKSLDLSRVSLENGISHDPASGWGRKNEEYVADFLLVAKRTLDESEHRIFRYHYLLGADWRLCCRKLEMDKGLFFHAAYRIQQKLGLVFRELQPYPLYPLREYFGVTMRQPVSKVVPIRTPAKPGRRLMPLKKSA